MKWKIIKMLEWIAITIIASTIAFFIYGIVVFYPGW